MKYKALLFDFDGVIGQTMEDNYLAWVKAFRTIVVEMDKTDYFMNEGLNTKHVAIRELKKNNLPIEQAEEIVKLKEKYYLESNNFSFYPGVMELIISLKDNYRLGIVSGASLQRLKKTVSQEFLRLFDTIITGDKVINPKPAPEPYMLASNGLQIPAGECIVVENAPLGIKAAKNANMLCVAICSTLDKKNLSQADYILESILELKNLLSQIN